MTDTLTRRRPGRELPKFERRIVGICVEQGWRYIPPEGNHAKLVPPDPDKPIVVFACTASDWRSRLNWLADLRRGGAVFDAPPKRKTVRPDGETPVMEYAPLGVGRPRLRNGANGWDYRPPAPEVPPPPAPVPDPHLATGEHYTLPQAKALIYQGYHVRRVVTKTGWGRKHFDDLVDETGYLATANERTTA